MINIELIRSNPDIVKNATRRRGIDVPIDRILELDAIRRSTIEKADGLRAHRNQVNRRLGQACERPPELIDEMREIGSRIKALEQQIRFTEEELAPLLTRIPNLHRDDVPPGQGDAGNVEIRSSGELPSYDFDPLPHWELGERLGIIDLQAGAKISGTRFFVLKGKGARLQRAAISWMLDLHTAEHGYQETYLPYLVNGDTMAGSSHLPHFVENMYHDEEDDLWLVPTAEAAITGLHKDEILAPGVLPLYYVAHTPCFRREKAAAGRDTRGIKRVHQFDKVEMYKLVEPETSPDELERLLEDAKDICKRLGLPYRVLSLCAGEMGFASAKSYDIEVWARGSKEWLEVSSCSNCTDFQARRSNIRYRASVSGKPMYVHTLNGSGLALPRIMIAIMENYQQEDGTIIVPKNLRPYMNGLEAIKI